MSTINKVMLIGHIGKDPYFRILTNGVSVLNFPLATTELISKGKKKVEDVSWHNIIMWRSIAEEAREKLKKGDFVYIEGSCRTHAYQDSNDIKRYVTEVVVDVYELLTGSELIENNNQISIGKASDWMSSKELIRPIKKTEFKRNY